MSMRAPDLVKVDATIGQGIANVFGIKGVKQAPQAVDMSAVDPVYDMGAGGFGAAEFVTAVDAVTFSIAGTTSTTRHVIAPLNFNATTLIPTQTQNARLLGLTAFVTFDAAGLAAFAGKTVGVQLGLLDAVNTAAGEIPIHQERYVVPAAGLTHRISINAAFWKGVIPNRYALGATIISYDGTNWPVNTTGRMFVVAARGALNQQLPN